jgi:hypothetical protein
MEEKWPEGGRRGVKHQKLNLPTENLSTPPPVPILNRYPIGQTAQNEALDTSTQERHGLLFAQYSS